MIDNIFDNTLAKRFSGLVVPQGALFYPCCGNDGWEAFQLFADTIDEFYFVDFVDVPKMPPPECLGNSELDYDGFDRLGSGVPVIPRTTVTEVKRSKNQAIAKNAEDKFWQLGPIERFVQKNPLFLEQEWTVQSDPVRNVRIFQQRQDGLTAFLGLDKISVFFLRGDSLGEGGSGQMWFQEPLFKLILEKLQPGGLIVTDGSGVPYIDGEQENRLPWSELWKNARSRDGRDSALPMDFVYAGRYFKCLGCCGHRYGPVYAWQVLDFEPSLLAENVSTYFQRLDKITRRSGMSRNTAMVETVSNILLLREWLLEDRKGGFHEDNYHFSWEVVRSYTVDDLTESLPLLLEDFSCRIRHLGLEIDLRSFETRDPQTLYELIQVLDRIMKLYEQESTDGQCVSKGDFFDAFLEYYFQGNRSGERRQGGEFHTPYEVVRMVAELAEAKPDDLVVDPFCGTGGFLTAIGKKVFSETNRTPWLYGFEIDARTTTLAKLNFLLHGYDPENINCIDSFSEKLLATSPELACNAFDVVLADLPVGARIDYRAMDPSLTNRFKGKRTEIFALALILRMMKQGARAVVLVPDGLLFGNVAVQNDFRRALLDENQVECVVSFRQNISSHSSIAMSLLVFCKGGSTDHVLFCDVDNDEGKDASNEGTERTIENWRRWTKNQDASRFADRSSDCFAVPLDEIIRNNCFLASSRYRQARLKTVAHESAESIFAQLQELEQGVLDQYKVLDKYLGKR